MDISNLSKQGKWSRMPSGLYVSRELRWGGDVLSLYRAALIAPNGIEKFNMTAGHYGVHMERLDPPVLKIQKISVYLSRKYKEFSFIPSMGQFVDMELDIASGMGSGGTQAVSRSPARYMHLTSEMVEFKEKMSGGNNDKKFRAVLLKFDPSSLAYEPVDEIIVADQGWIRVFGARHGYPLETSKDPGPIENLDIRRPLRKEDAMGYWNVGQPPVGEHAAADGHRRIVVRGSFWHTENPNMFDAHAGEHEYSMDKKTASVRFRQVLPEDYNVQIEEARAELERLHEGLGEIRSRIRELERKG